MRRAHEAPGTVTGTVTAQDKWQLLLLLFKEGINPTLKTSSPTLTPSRLHPSIFVSATPQLEPGTNGGTGKSCQGRIQHRATLILSSLTVLGKHSSEGCCCIQPPPWEATLGPRAQPSKLYLPFKARELTCAHAGAGWSFGSAEAGCQLRPVLPAAQTSLPIPSRPEHRAS